MGRKPSGKGSNKKATEKVKPVPLTHAGFLEKVHNYEKNTKKWTYLGDKPCIIDFYADWCGPCHSIAPVLEELADEYKDEIYIYKVNTDADRKLANAFEIMSIPTLIFCPMNDFPK